MANNLKKMIKETAKNVEKSQIEDVVIIDSIPEEVIVIKNEKEPRNIPVIIRETFVHTCVTKSQFDPILHISL